MLLTRVLEAGGSISPLVIPSSASGGTGLMNPSPLVVGDQIFLNLRQTNYILYHSEGSQRFYGNWGPLAYLHPEDDMKLRTKNFICDLDPKTLTIKDYAEVDTSGFDKEPLWEFVGLEDARLVDWGALYMCGVRRDTTTNGQGRMELSKIDPTSDGVIREVSRFRVPAPGADDTYCEKNWMPVLDMPFHFVKWSNPTEVVKVDPEAGTCEQVVLKENATVSTADLRGGSQVIPFGDYRIAIVHEVGLWQNYLNQKDGVYKHRLLVWDYDWNLVGVSPEPWSFMGGQIEFCAGVADWKGDLLVTFGFQDNSAHLMSVPSTLATEMVQEAVKHVSG